MKKILFVLSILALSLGSATAQTISAADRKGIDETFAGVGVAFGKMDASLMSPWLAENVEQITPSGQIIRGKANLIANMTGYFGYLKSLPKPDQMEQKNTNQQFRYIAPDLVLVTHTQETTVSTGGKSKTEKESYALLFRNTGGKWLTELVSITAVAPENK